MKRAGRSKLAGRTKLAIRRAVRGAIGAGGRAVGRRASARELLVKERAGRRAGGGSWIKRSKNARVYKYG